MILGIIITNAQIKVVGHRGVRFNTPESPVTEYYENTIQALKYCQSLGIYAAEFDVQLHPTTRSSSSTGPMSPV